MTDDAPQSQSTLPQRRLGRVLVTGAGGFIGATLIRVLTQANETVIASDLARGEGASESFRVCDITDPSQVDALIGDEAFDTIIHCGAVSGPMVMADRPLEIWRINALGTAHMLEAARRRGVGRFVLCSTSSVYGLMQGVTIDEDTPPNPDTVYGASKVAAEQAMIGYVREHGVDAVALRLSWIYGPGRNTPTTLEQILKATIQGKAFEIDASPSDMTHYLFIEDVVRGLIAAAGAARIPRLIYNITAGPGAAFSQITTALRDLAPEARLTFAHDEGPETGASGFDPTNAARDLGYQPRIALAEGLARYRDALRRDMAQRDDSAGAR